MNRGHSRYLQPSMHPGVSVESPVLKLYFEKKEGNIPNFQRTHRQITIVQAQLSLYGDPIHYSGVISYMAY